MDAATETFDQLTHDRADSEESAAQNRQDRTNLLRSGRAITVDELQAARQTRDQSWADLHAHLLGEQVIAEVGAAATEFEIRVAVADSLADERYLSAQASAQLMVLDNSFAKLQLDIEQVEARLVAALREQEEANGAWQTELRTRGLPELSPPRLREWMAEREAVLNASNAVDEARQAVEDADQQRNDAIAHLHEATPPNRRLATSPSLFAHALEHAESIVIDLSDQQKLFRSTIY